MSCVLHPHALLAGASELVTCRLLICGLLSIDLLSHKQAAEAAGRRYVWSVSASDGLLLARVLSVVDGCLNPDPASRWTIPRVLEALTAVQRDAMASNAASVVRPPPLPSPTGALATVAAAAPSFDVLAIVDAMEAAGIDAGLVSSVANAIGVSLTSPLDVLTAHRVPVMKTAAVRRRVESSGAASESTTSVRTRL